MDYGAIMGCLLYIGLPLLIAIVMMSGKSEAVDHIIVIALQSESVEYNEEEVMYD